MDIQPLHVIISKLQDRLSNEDRQRLHFFLGNDVPRYIRDDVSVGGTSALIESLIQQDKINEKDMTLLIDALEKTPYSDIAQLLKEYVKQIQSNELNNSISMITAVSNNDKENSLVDQNNYSHGKNLPLYNNNTTTVNPITVVLVDPSNVPLKSKQTQLFNLSSKTSRGLLLCMILSTILTGLMISIWCGINYMQIKNNNQLKNEEFLQLNLMLLKYNETIQQMANKDEQKFTEGSACGCKNWCSEHGLPYGVCGDGPTCICSKTPLTKENTSSGCTCDGWCRKNDHKDGGICGDGYTCICSK